MSKALSLSKAVVICALSALPLAAQESTQPVGFGPLEWGATKAEVQAAYPNAKCKPYRVEKGKAEECKTDFKIGSLSTKLYLLVRDTDGLTEATVTFDSGIHEEIKDLLFEKYGDDVKMATEPDRFASPGDEVTTTRWEWDGARVTLYDQRKHTSYSRHGRFEVKAITEDEKAEKKKALNAF